MSAASESTMRLMSGSVTENWELSAIKGCDLSTRATYLRVYTVSPTLLYNLKHICKIATFMCRQFTHFWYDFVVIVSDCSFKFARLAVYSRCSVLQCKILYSKFYVPYSKFYISYSKFYIPYSKFYISYSKFYIPYSKFYIPYSKFYIPYSKFYIPYSKFYIRYSMFYIPYSKFYIPYSKFYIPYSKFYIPYSKFYSTANGDFHFLR